MSIFLEIQSSFGMNHLKLSMIILDRVFVTLKYSFTIFLVKAFYLSILSGINNLRRWRG